VLVLNDILVVSTQAPTDEGPNRELKKHVPAIVGEENGNGQVDVGERTSFHEGIVGEGRNSNERDAREGRDSNEGIDGEGRGFDEQVPHDVVVQKG